jgi:peptidoglycan hydrolase CwlO-like protein
MVMKHRYAVMTAVILLAGTLAASDGGAAPGLWGGVSYLDASELATEIERRERDMARANARIEELEESMSSLEGEIEALEQARRRQAREARRAIIMHDRLSRGGMLRIVLDSGSLTDAAVFARLYSRLLESQGEVFSELEAKEEALLSKKAAYEEDRASLEKLRSDLEEHSKALERRRETLLSL